MQTKIEKIRSDYQKEPQSCICYIDDYHKYLENIIIKNDEFNFKRFMRLQIDEIEKYKWYKSEKAGHDLGNSCCQEWIERFAKSFAKKYWDD